MTPFAMITASVAQQYKNLYKFALLLLYKLSSILGLLNATKAFETQPYNMDD